MEKLTGPEYVNVVELLRLLGLVRPCDLSEEVHAKGGLSSHEQKTMTKEVHTCWVTVEEVPRFILSQV